MDPVNLQAIWPHCSPWKEKQQTFLEAMSKHTKDKEVTGNRKHVFIEGKSYPNNMIAFCGEVTSTVEKERAVAGLYVAFSSAWRREGSGDTL